MLTLVEHENQSMIAVGLGRKHRRQFNATRSVVKRGSWIARILNHETKKVC